MTEEKEIKPENGEPEEDGDLAAERDDGNDCNHHQHAHENRVLRGALALLAAQRRGHVRSHLLQSLDVLHDSSLLLGVTNESPATR